MEKLVIFHMSKIPRNFAMPWRWIIQMANKGTFGVNNYHARTRKKIGRHKKNMNKTEKRNFKRYVGQGR